MNLLNILIFISTEFYPKNKLSKNFFLEKEWYIYY